MRISDGSSDVCSSDLTGSSSHNVGGHSLARLILSLEIFGTGSMSPPTMNARLTELQAEVERLRDKGQIGRATSELQSLMRISYAVFCLKKKTNTRYTTIKKSDQNSTHLSAATDAA